MSQKNAELKQENISLYREIGRLKNDPKYVENVARQELGVIGKDEVIIKVKKPSVSNRKRKVQKLNTDDVFYTRTMAKVLRIRGI